MTKKKDRDVPTIQWAAAFVGAAVVIGTIAFLAWEAITGDQSPQAINLTQGPAIATESGFTVSVVVANAGGNTAADVLITGELVAGDSVVESSEFTLDYVPSRSRRNGGLFFTTDPRSLQLRLRASGYVEP